MAVGLCLREVRRGRVVLLLLAFAFLKIAVSRAGYGSGAGDSNFPTVKDLPPAERLEAEYAKLPASERTRLDKQLKLEQNIDEEDTHATQGKPESRRGQFGSNSKRSYSYRLAFPIHFVNGGTYGLDWGVFRDKYWGETRREVPADELDPDKKDSPPTGPRKAYMYRDFPLFHQKDTVSQKPSRAPTPVSSDRDKGSDRQPRPFASQDSYGLQRNPLHETAVPFSKMPSTPSKENSLSGDASKDASTDASKDASTDASKDASTDASKDASTDVSKDASTDASKDASTDVSGDALADVSGEDAYGLQRKAKPEEERPTPSQDKLTPRQSEGSEDPPIVQNVSSPKTSTLEKSKHDFDFPRPIDFGEEDDLPSDDVMMAPRLGKDWEDLGDGINPQFDPECWRYNSNMEEDIPVTARVARKHHTKMIDISETVRFVVGPERKGFLELKPLPDATLPRPGESVYILVCNEEEQCLYPPPEVKVSTCTQDDLEHLVRLTEKLETLSEDRRTLKFLTASKTATARSSHDVPESLESWNTEFERLEPKCRDFMADRTLLKGGLRKMPRAVRPGLPTAKKCKQGICDGDKDVVDEAKIEKLASAVDMALTRHPEDTLLDLTSIGNVYLQEAVRVRGTSIARSQTRTRGPPLWLKILWGIGTVIATIFCPPVGIAMAVTGAVVSATWSFVEGDIAGGVGALVGGALSFIPGVGDVVGHAVGGALGHVIGTGIGAATNSFISHGVGHAINAGLASHRHRYRGPTYGHPYSHRHRYRRPTYGHPYRCPNCGAATGVASIEPLVLMTADSTYRRNRNGRYVAYGVHPGYDDDYLQIGSEVLDPPYSKRFCAAREGHLHTLAEILEREGGDINRQEGLDGDTMLMMAASEGHVKTAKYLLEKGASTAAVNNDDKTALILAASMNQVHALRLLLQKTRTGDYKYLRPGTLNHQDKTGKTALLWACMYGSYEVVEMLLNENSVQVGVDNNENTCLHLATQARNTATGVKLLEMDTDKPLVKTRLLGMKATQLNKHGEDLLMIAARTDNLELVNAVVAPVRTDSDYIRLLERKDLRFERTPVLWAARYGNLSILKAFMQYPESVSDRPFKKLRQLAVPWIIRDKNQASLLTLFGCGGNTKFLEYLRVKASRWKFLINAFGGSDCFAAFDCAKRNGHDKASKLLFEQVVSLRLCRPVTSRVRLPNHLRL